MDDQPENSDSYPFSDPSVVWKSISLTHVEYPKGDLLGCALAWCSLMPIFLLVSFGTLVAFKRDLHTICYLIGLVGNEAANLVLKHTFKEHRPHRKREVLFTEYGMPSSHSQFMWFFSTYLVLFLIIRVRSNPGWRDNIWKYCLSLAGFVAAVLVSHSRVYLGYHSQNQVVAGAVVGIVIGAIWFFTVHEILTPYFPSIVQWPIAEFFLIRDCTPIPNILWFEYRSSRTEASYRQMRRMTSRKSQ